MAFFPNATYILKKLFGADYDTGGTKVVLDDGTTAELPVIPAESDPVFTAWDKDYDDLTNKPDLSSLHASGSDNQTASNVPVTTTSFGGIFANSSSFDTVQECLDSVDDHSHPVTTIVPASLTIDSSEGGDTGAYTDLSDTHANYVTINENTGASPMTVRIGFTGVTLFEQVVIRYRYAGSASHNIAVELYNNDTTSYDQFAVIANTGANYQYLYILVPDYAHYINSGAVTVRFRHIENGSNTHVFYLDYVALRDHPLGSSAGDVIGPSSSVDSQFAAFDGTSGKVVKDSGYSSSSFQAADADLTDLATKWTAASASGQASLQFHEDADNGTNKVILQPAAALSADFTVTLPSATDTLVTLTQAETLTNKTFTNYQETIYSTTTAGNVTIDLANGNVQRFILDAARQFTMPADPGLYAKSFVLIIECATYTPTWNATPTIEWLTSDGTAPTLVTTASLVNVLTFIWDDVDSRWLGFLAGKETA